MIARLLERGQLRRLRAATARCAEAEARYLGASGSLAQAVALAGLAPSPDDRERIDDLRAQVALQERARRGILVEHALAQRALRDLIGWFDLEPLIDAPAPPLAVDWSPRAVAWRGRVDLRLHFTEQGALRALHIGFDAALTTSPRAAPALHDLFASALAAMATTARDRAAREVARALRLQGLRALDGADTGGVDVTVMAGAQVGRGGFHIGRRGDA